MKIMKARMRIFRILKITMILKKLIIEENLEENMDEYEGEFDEYASIYLENASNANFEDEEVLPEDQDSNNNFSI